jgi:hypothetical protein
MMHPLLLSHLGFYLLPLHGGQHAENLIVELLPIGAPLIGRRIHISLLGCAHEAFDLSFLLIGERQLVESMEKRTAPAMMPTGRGAC